MAEQTITESEITKWHDMAIDTVADALVNDFASRTRMMQAASTLAFAVLRLLAERSASSKAEETSE
jgi:hypothetical protein